MSPEAIEKAWTVDARSDLYAFGAVGYFLLTGSPVFQGENIVDICMRHVDTPPVAPSLRLGRPVSPDLEAVILRCLAKSRDDRPQSARELDHLLGQAKVSGTWTEEDGAAWWKSVMGVAMATTAQLPTHSEGETATMSAFWPPGWSIDSFGPGKPVAQHAQHRARQRAGQVDPDSPSDPPTIAGASDRAGFIEAPEIGPANSTSKAITPPMATPANSPFSFGPESDPQDHKHQYRRQHDLQHEALPGRPARRRSAQRGGLEHQPHQHTSGNRANQLADDVGQDQTGRQPAGQPKAERDRRIQVSTRGVADGINHGHHQQAPGQGDADVGHLAPRHFVNDDRPGADEDQDERGDRFGDVFSHR